MLPGSISDLVQLSLEVALQTEQACCAVAARAIENAATRVCHL